LFVVSLSVEVAFDLHVSLTNTVRLVPMQLDFAQRAVGQSNRRDPFELSGREQNETACAFKMRLGLSFY
jgi:hypothetical protein